MFAFLCPIECLNKQGQDPKVETIILWEGGEGELFFRLFELSAYRKIQLIRPSFDSRW